jgi:hypothetical protein
VKSIVKTFFFLFLIYLALAGISYLLSQIFPDKTSFKDLSIFLTAALIIAVISSYIFFRGLRNSESKSVLYTLSAIGVKFLLFLGLLGIFALVKDDLSWQFLVIIFVMYISFTVYLLITFVNILKSKNKERPDGKGNQIS